MFTIRLTAPFFGLAIAAPVLLQSAPALAGNAACAHAYESAQVQKSSGKLREAHKNLLICAQSGCPAFIAKSCTQWLSEVNTALPSIVVAASDAKGNDLVDVTVSFDGQKLTDKLGGMAINVNPGQHTLRFEHDGDKPIEKKVLIREGEKARVLKVQFEPPAKAVTQPLPAPASGGGAVGVGTSSHGSSKTLAYILGGVGVVGLGSFAYFGLTGSSQRSDLLGRCTGGVCNLPQDQIDSKRSSVKTKFLIADISLGVGVVALGVATYLFFKPEHRQEAQKDGARLHFDMALTRRGSYASVAGSF